MILNLFWRKILDQVIQVFFFELLLQHFGFKKLKSAT